MYYRRHFRPGDVTIQMFFSIESSPGRISIVLGSGHGEFDPRCSESTGEKPNRRCIRQTRVLKCPDFHYSRIRPRLFFIDFKRKINKFPDKPDRIVVAAASFPPYSFAGVPARGPIAPTRKMIWGWPRPHCRRNI